MSYRGEQICPNRILDDFGQGFSMGCIGGAIWYFIKGMYNSPKNERFFGGIKHLKRRAPILGGSFALWAGLFSTCDCTLIHLRGKEDFINPIIAGTITGGCLAIRSGFRVAFRNAIFGGVILAMIGLVEMGMIKYQMRMEMREMHAMQKMANEKETEALRQMHPHLFKDSDAKKARALESSGAKITTH